MFHFLLGRETASGKSGLFFRFMMTRYDDKIIGCSIAQHYANNRRMQKGIPLQNKQQRKIERGKHLHLARGAENNIKQRVVNI